MLLSENWLQMRGKVSRQALASARAQRPLFLLVSGLTLVTAGQDATEAFYGLHRHEVLERPQYQRLQVGVIKDEKPVIYGAQVPGQISLVPYAEPTWLSKGFKSPYFDDVCPLPF